ncbi:recombinase family protein [Brevibacterium sp. 91QC2O2]|uniref:recombinase family protein n=1 Tax=Brevibacterium TaxID=1696 RepID=UPI00211C10D9|nr:MULTISPECIES: recombinase family protein [unclassified Brevibacterium]MCQ9367386.1 recombinase family protein [Brevibacterium sp. 91QC2O2]MCQ9384601.1 recombinase family protein [Brevibacterium sp. 68QC2CO]
MSDRAVLYLRQSVAREESISLELQESACRRHCEERGYQVVAVKADPGISGRTWRRPAVVQTMEMIEEHEAEVIVLWKWSRLSRSRRDWAVADDRVRVAGGRIESATEDIDVSTSHGRLARGMMVEFAAFESERIGDQWREAHARRVSMGLPANGKPRFGYRRAGEGFEPDPETGPVLAEAYRRFVSGESSGPIVEWLNGLGLHPASGYGHSVDSLWSRRTLIRCLDTGFGAGFIRSHGELLPGVQEAVITPQEWEAYLARRRKQQSGPRNVARSPYLLSGFIRCACGGMMTGGTRRRGTPQERSQYRCRQSSEKNTHRGGYVNANYVERAVLDWLRRLADDLDHATTAAAAAEQRRTRIVADVADMDRQIHRLGQSRAHLTVLLAQGAITHGAYQGAVDEMEADLSDLASRRSAAAAERARLPVDMSAAARDILTHWDVLPVTQRREALSRLIRVVVVTPRKPAGTIRIVPAWTEDE